MTITRTQLRTLRIEMQAALNKAGIPNFEFSVGNMSFGATDVNIKVKGTLTGTVCTEDALFSSKVEQFGLKTVGQKGNKLTGFVPSRYKYPFTYETVRGTRYKCSEVEAQRMFG